MDGQILVLAAGNERGGAASHLGILARAIRRAELEEHFTFALVGDGPLATSLQEAGVCTLILSPSPIRAVRELRGRLKVLGGTGILHSHGPRLNVIAYLATLGTSVLRMSTIHSHLYKDFLASRLKTIIFTRLNRFCLDRADGVFVVHPDYGEWFPNRRVFYVPNGIEMTELHYDKTYYRDKLRERLSVDRDAKVFGIAARFDPVKDIPTVIRALSAMTVDAHFAIAGDGAERESLVRCVREEGVEPRVHFLGFTNQVREFYAGLDVHVLASHSEGTPFSILEAGLLSVPNVGTEIPGITRLIADGETGRCFPVGDSLKLAAILDELLENPSLRRELAERFANQVLPDFTPEKMLNAYLEGYQEMLAGSGTVKVRERDNQWK